MKTKSFYLTAFALLFCTFVTFSACKKDPPIETPQEEPNPNEQPSDTIYFSVEGIRVSNGVVSEKGYSNVKIKAEFNAFNVSSFTVTDYGHCLSKTNNLPTLQDNNGISSLGERTSVGQFTSTIEELEPGTTYYARVYLKKDDNSVAYHPNSISFTTLNPAAPDVTILQIDDIQSSSVSIDGKILDLKEEAIIDHGFVWSKDNESPSVSENDGILNLGEVAETIQHEFSGLIEGLIPNTNYHVRAFAKNQHGTSYGAGSDDSAESFTTLTSPLPYINLSSVTLASDENNNDEPNPDETVVFLVTLENSGQSSASGVTANFISSHMNILTSTPVDFGNISTGGSTSQPLEVKINDNFNPGADAEIQIIIDYAGEEQWIYTHSFEVFPTPQPELTINSVAFVSDENGTGEPNPGETVEYLVTITNSGEASATGTEVNLFGDDISVVSSNPVFLGSIDPAETETFEIEVQFDEFLNSGQSVELEFDMQESNGGSWDYTHSFQIFPSPQPVLTLGSVVLESDANDTGEPNPGEIVEYTIVIENTGDAEANGVQVNMISNDMSILSSNPAFLGSVAPGESGTFEIEVEFNENLDWGEYVDLEFEIQDSNGENWNDSHTFQVVSPVVVNNSLLFYLPFEECSGTSTMDIAGNVTGDLFGGANFTSDTPFGIDNECALQVSPSNEYVHFPANPIYGVSEMSVAFWMKTGGDNFHIYRCGNQGNSGTHYLRIIDQEFNGVVNGGGVSSYDIGNYLNNNWHHFAITVEDGVGSKLYVNGDLKLQVSIEQIIGTTSGYTTRLFYSTFQDSPAAKIDNFRLYNRPISAAEVSTIYTAGQ